MYQNYGKFDRAERLIQHVIEVFDLVEIIPAEGTGRSMRSRFIQPDIPSAARYSEAQGAIACGGTVHRKK